MRILKASAEGLPGLKQCDARESLIAFLIMRLDKKPPTLAEERLHCKYTHAIHTTACYPGCL